jgi:aspartyl protease family protein
MGLTRVRIVVTPVERKRPRRTVDFLVDSGAVFTVLPEPVWAALRLRVKDGMTFSLADGTSIERGVSEARFIYQGRDRVSPVVLGEGGDEALLGAVTLETLGLVLNPLSREVLPMRLTLAAADGAPSGRRLDRIPPLQRPQPAIEAELEGGRHPP